MSKVMTLLREELYGLHVPFFLARLALAILPPYVGSRLRVAVLRLAGFQLGRGTVLWGTPLITGSGALHTRLAVGESCWINIGCLFDVGDEITIGQSVSIGQRAMILTTSHAIGDAARRAGPLTTAPVRIDDGAWIGAHATILPGVTIGAGAVVAAGAVVTKSVAPNQLVAGVPAKPLRTLDPEECPVHDALPEDKQTEGAGLSIRQKVLLNPATFEAAHE